MRGDVGGLACPVGRLVLVIDKVLVLHLTLVLPPGQTSRSDRLITSIIRKKQFYLSILVIVY